MSDKGEHEHDYTQEEHQLDEIQVPPTRMGSRVQNLGRHRYDSAESYPPRPWLVLELDILLACEQTQWSKNGGEDEKIKTHENEKYRLQRVRTLHLGVTGKVEEARLLVRIPQVPVGDGTKRHEAEAELPDSDTAVVDGERR